MIIESSAYQTRYSAIEEVMKSNVWTTPGETRRAFIGGSDARIIMGSDEAALIRLWREKRGEVEPEDLPATSSCSLGPPRKGSTVPGTSATRADASLMFSAA
jgi:hypothetical protein